MRVLKNNSKGFTLIELLVVIAIIALLLSIITPALRKVKESGRILVCRTNSKSLGLATILWSEDNDGWALPALWDRGYKGDSLLKPYMGDYETGSDSMNCPSAKKYEGKTFDELGLTADVAGLASGGNYYNSYGYNLKLCAPTSRCPGSYDTPNDDGSTWGRDGVWYKKHGNCKLGTVRTPSRKILFAECLLYVSYPEFYTKAMMNPAFNDPSERGRRHNVKTRPVGSSDTEECGQMNITWIDGSVSIEPDDMDSLSDDGRRWNINGSYWYGSLR
jgi:prepilin-type N-terminal cleavage/methylation domain-containing protein